MGRHDYAVTDIGAYGVPAQPAVVARMRPHLMMTRVGVGAAVVALVAGIASLLTFAQFTDWAWLWPVLVLGASVVMVAICALQAWVWHQAMAEWSGLRDVNLAGFMTPSWAAHLLSYAAVLAGLVGALFMMGDTGAGAASFWWSLVAGVSLVVAQLTAAVEYLRLDGPPGTLPAHFRRLLKRENPGSSAGRAAASGILRTGDDEADGATRAETEKT
ncbi:hypothetical protein [Mariniluteicoccus flavus]